MTPKENVDVLENYLRKQGRLLDILLKDRTTGRNIIWATDSYVQSGKKSDSFLPTKSIKAEFVTGKYGKLIQPRAVKTKEEQKRRTKEKAEVFTPLKIVKQMNEEVDKAIKDNQPNYAWQEYVQMLKLEITCGEAPYIVSRYDPTLSTGKMLPLKKRVGFLDKKLQVIEKNCSEKEDWFFWVKEAYKASYGYEWQGDNLLIARENLLYSFYDYYQAQFETDKLPPMSWREEIAEIISWNIWQMDGLKYTVPYKNEGLENYEFVDKKQPTLSLLFTSTEKKATKAKSKKTAKSEKTDEAEENTEPVYAKIKDWTKGKTGKTILFKDLVERE